MKSIHVFMQGSLQSEVEALNHSIAGQMISCGVQLLDTEDSTHIMHQVRKNIGSTVR